MNRYQDKLTKEAEELESKAKEEHKLARMTPEERRAYRYGKILGLESIYFAGRKDGS